MCVCLEFYVWRVKIIILRVDPSSRILLLSLFIRFHIYFFLHCKILGVRTLARTRTIYSYVYWLQLIVCSYSHKWQWLFTKKKTKHQQHTIEFCFHWHYNKSLPFRRLRTNSHMCVRELYNKSIYIHINAFILNDSSSNSPTHTLYHTIFNILNWHSNMFLSCWQLILNGCLYIDYVCLSCCCYFFSFRFVFYPLGMAVCCVYAYSILWVLIFLLPLLLLLFCVCRFKVI